MFTWPWKPMVIGGFWFDILNSLFLCTRIPSDARLIIMEILFKCFVVLVVQIIYRWVFVSFVIASSSSKIKMKEIIFCDILKLSGCCCRCNCNKNNCFKCIQIQQQIYSRVRALKPTALKSQCVYNKVREQHSTIHIVVIRDGGHSWWWS